MKEGIHPPYTQATVTCACGTTFTVGSTIAVIHTEVCSACHPFYTGEKKLVDATGRVERFEKIAEKSQTVKAKRAAAKTAPRKKKTEVLTERQWRKQVKLG